MAAVPEGSGEFVTMVSGITMLIVNVRLVEPWLDPHTTIPLYLACVTIPAYALANVQEGIARSYDWVGLSMMPVYVVRQLLLTLRNLEPRMGLEALIRAMVAVRERFPRALLLPVRERPPQSEQSSSKIMNWRSWF